MTKKDYILIAEALRASRPRADVMLSPDAYEPNENSIMRGARITHARMCTNIAQALASDNPRFNESKFIEAINK